MSLCFKNHKGLTRFYRIKNSMKSDKFTYGRRVYNNVFNFHAISRGC